MNAITINGIEFTDQAPTEAGAYWCCEKRKPEYYWVEQVGLHVEAGLAVQGEDDVHPVALMPNYLWSSRLVPVGEMEKWKTVADGLAGAIEAIGVDLNLEDEPTEETEAQVNEALAAYEILKKEMK